MFVTWFNGLNITYINKNPPNFIIKSGFKFWLQ